MKQEGHPGMSLPVVLQDLVRVAALCAARLLSAGRRGAGGEPGRTARGISCMVQWPSSRGDQWLGNQYFRRKRRHRGRLAIVTTRLTAVSLDGCSNQRRVWGHHAVLRGDV